MGLANDENVMINTRLMKLAGFYQILCPDTAKVFGVNVFKIAVACLMACVATALAMLLVSIYYSLDDFNTTMSYVMMIVGAVFTVFKLYYIVTYSDVLWGCLQLAKLDTFAYGRHDADTLRRGRSMSLSFSTFFFFLWLSVTASWVLSPLFITNYYTTVRTADGRARRFRYNTMNMVYPVTEQYYNGHFAVFYAFEALTLWVMGHTALIYDMLLISMCITISYQLKTVANSYGAFNAVPRGSTSNTSKNIKDINEHLMSEFKVLIQDQQLIVKNMRDIYLVFRPVTLVQLAVESVVIIIQPCMIIMNYFNGFPLTSLVNLKLIFLVLTNTFHLYFTCFLFNDLNEKKDSMNFAIYCSDWTGMNVQYKKLLLLCMRMNTAEKLKLKVSIGRIVNIEMFANVMHTTYSIISVMTKSYSTK